MKVLSALLFVFIVLFHPPSANSQEISNDKDRKIPYIAVVDCVKCKELVISLPSPKYPGSVGFGPHKYNGNVAVQIVINESGTVKTATAVSGHPFFRNMLERESLKATFRPLIEIGIPRPITATIVFRVVSTEVNKKTNMNLGIVNGMASYLPKPAYPQLPIDACASGQVRVQVLIGNNGKVKKAEAISGNRLLRNSAVNAAKLARFSRNVDGPPIEISGIVVYNFPPSSGCPREGVN